MGNTSITLGERFESFAAEQVKNGRYGSISEVVRVGLLVLEEREMKIEALRSVLAEGENSGRADYSIEKLIEELDG